MEKYSRVYHFNGQYYIEKSPIILLAGALLKDNYNGEILAQLKFKSISRKNIKAIKVELELYDPSQKVQEKTASHQYLDLNIARNEEFGSQEPIKIPYSDTRYFKVKVKEVIYSNGEIWTNNSDWISIPTQKQLNTMLVEHELDFFRNRYTKKAQYVPKKQYDLWQCTCGTICLEEEARCTQCGFAQKDIDNINYDELKKEALYNISLSYLDTTNLEKLEKARENLSKLDNYKDARNKKNECISKIEKVKEDTQNRMKQIKKTSIIAGITLVSIALIIGIVFYFVNVYIPNKNYQKALEYKSNKQYAEAIEQFLKMPKSYENTYKLLNECYVSYAEVLIENKQYEEAIGQLKKLPKDYPEVKKLLEEYQVSYAQYLTENKQYEDALDIYEELNYSDQNENKLETMYQYASNLLENGEYEEAYNEFILCKKYEKSEDKAKEAAKKYATKLLEEDNTEDAMKWYTIAGDKNAINKIKYSYVKEHYKTSDETTYKYLVELVKGKYSDSLKLYNKLYNIKAQLVINSSKTNTTSAPTTIPQTAKYEDLYGHYKITGNIPDGKANIKTVYETRWGYDDVPKEGWKKNNYFTSDSMKVELNKWQLAYLDMASNLYYHRVRIYNADTGELLATSATVHTPYYR